MKKKLNLTILGMHCASCAINIETFLKNQAGIVKANVNFASEKLGLEFETEKISLSQIKKHINKLGYRIAETKTAQGEEVKKLRRSFLISFFLGLPLIYLSMGKMLGLPMIDVPLRLNSLIQLAITSLIMAFNQHLYVSGVKKLLSKKTKHGLFDYHWHFGCLFL